MTNELELNIHHVLAEKGIAGLDWRIKIINKEVIGRSDWAKVSVEIYPPRKRKPVLVWVLAINFVRNIIDWEKSDFYKP